MAVAEWGGWVGGGGGCCRQSGLPTHFLVQMGVDRSAQEVGAGEAWGEEWQEAWGQEWQEVGAGDAGGGSG
jgi:hypothetical protein